MAQQSQSQEKKVGEVRGYVLEKQYDITSVNGPTKYLQFAGNSFSITICSTKAVKRFVKE